MLALLAPVLALAQPQAATTLLPDAETRWVSFELTQYNQIRFSLELGGRVVDAILDTGLSDTIITSRFAERAGIEPRTRVEAVAIGGNVPVSWAASPDIAFGGLRRAGGRIGVVQSSEASRFGGDMLVGADLLGCCALDIDYDASRFRIVPSGRMPFRGVSAALRRGERSGIYVSAVRLGGKTLMPVVVDTGDGATLTLSPAAWAAAGSANATMTSVIGWGMGGPSETRLAVIPSFSIAGQTHGEAEVRIEDDRGFLSVTGWAGRIGTGTLSHYRVLLDPKAERMVLKPARAFGTPVLRSTSGLLLEYRAGQFNVVHVMRGSPAEKTGWKSGERICETDGLAVSEQVVASGLADWTAGAPGRTVRLKLCDGSERQLTLARFY